MATEFEQQIAERLSVDTEEIAPVLDAVIDRIRQQVANFGYARLSGLGTFRRRDGRISFEPEPALVESTNVRFSGLGTLDVDLGAIPTALGLEAEETLEEAEISDGTDTTPDVDLDASEQQSAEVHAADHDAAGIPDAEAESDRPDESIWLEEDARSTSPLGPVDEPSYEDADFAVVDESGADEPHAFDAADDTWQAREGVSSEEENAWPTAENIEPADEPWSAQAGTPAEGEARPASDFDESDQDSTPAISWNAPPQDAPEDVRDERVDEILIDERADELDDETADELVDERAGELDDEAADELVDEQDGELVDERDGRLDEERTSEGAVADAAHAAGDASSEASADRDPVEPSREPNRTRKRSVWIAAGAVLVIAAIAAAAYLVSISGDDGPRSDQMIAEQSTGLGESSEAGDPSASESPSEGQGPETATTDDAAGPAGDAGELTGGPGETSGNASRSEDAGDQETQTSPADDSSIEPSATASQTADPLRGPGGIDRAAGGYTIIVFSDRIQGNASELAQEYQANGFRAEALTFDEDGGTLHRVAVGQFSTLEEALAARNRLAGTDIPADAWLLRVE